MFSLPIAVCLALISMTKVHGELPSTGHANANPLFQIDTFHKSIEGLGETGAKCRVLKTTKMTGNEIADYLKNNNLALPAEPEAAESILDRRAASQAVRPELGGNGEDVDRPRLSF